MTKDTGSRNFNRIEKRAIEALAIAPVIAAVSGKIGRRDAMALPEEVNRQEAFDRGQSMRTAGEANAIDVLVAEVASWGAGAVWEMDILEQTDTTYFFNVTRCPYYEKYRELGLEDLGVALSCCRDAAFTQGLNPRFELVRTRTIMEGADHCDFRYTLHPG